MESRIHREMSVRFGGEEGYSSLAYGAKNQPAQPFVRPAIKSCESSVRAAMQKVFNRRVAGANSRSK